MTPMPTKPMIAGGDRPPLRNACCRGEGGEDVGDEDGVGELEGEDMSEEVGRGLISSAGYGVGRRGRGEEDMSDASGHVGKGQLT